MANEQNNTSGFGKSLALRDGDLHFSEGDLAMVAGEDNFLQAMQVMIETPAGTDIFNVNYGFDLLNSIGRPEEARLVKEFIRLNIVRSLTLDNRVREVREVVFSDDPRFFELSPETNADRAAADRRAARRWRVIVVLQTVSEGEVTLRLEGTGL
jgi:phage baseplate assembly protein W